MSRRFALAAEYHVCEMCRENLDEEFRCLCKQILGEWMDLLRKRMEKEASLWGRDHPSVYRLSEVLDFLHNEWTRVDGIFSSGCCYYKSWNRELSVFFRPIA